MAKQRRIPPGPNHILRRPDPPRPRATRPTDSDEEVGLLLQALRGLQIRDWDFLLIGDGSGSQWDRGVGWASVSLERFDPQPRIWTGAMNSGTVNFAEIMAYLQPLNWLAAREQERRRQGRQARAYQVHIITDSQYCREQGKAVGATYGKNAALWAAFDVLARQGFVLNWHWRRRDELVLNQYTDHICRLARKWFEQFRH